MAIDFLALLAQALGEDGLVPPPNSPGGILNAQQQQGIPNTVGEEDIFVPGARPVRKVMPPTPDVIAPGGPSIVQPEFVQPPANMRDPSRVDPNSPNLLDRRLMIFQAQEAQRQAAAQAAGLKYEPKTQTSLEEFKAKPGLKFGTRGVARDIIGNAFDFVGSLVGREPTYRKERWLDEIYGWDQPGQQDAAIARAMQYDPEMTTKFLTAISGVDAQRTNTEANQAYKKVQTEAYLAKRVGSMATALISSGDPEGLWPQYRPAMQEHLRALGEPMELSEVYDPNVVNGLSRYGYGPG